MARRNTGNKRRITQNRAPKPASTASNLEHWLLQKEVWGLVLAATGAVTLIALISKNQGKLSDAWSLLLRQVFGVGAYPVALLLVVGGVVLLLRGAALSAAPVRWQSIVGWELFFFAGLGLIHAAATESPLESARAGRHGGYVGWALGRFLIPLVGRTISLMLLSAILLGGLYLVVGIPWSLIAWRIRWAWARGGVRVREAYAARTIQRPAPEVPPVSHTVPPQSVRRRAPAKKRVTEAAPAAKPTRSRREPSKDPKSGGSPKRSARSPKSATTRAARTPSGVPSLDVLIPDDSDQGNDADARHGAQVIEETLEAFGVPAKVTEWNRGPVVTQFGVEPGYTERLDREGNTRRQKVRVSRILSLANDLALALAASPIRIEAPVPGRPMVGIEVPNSEKALVGLRGVLESPQFRKMRAKLRFALGRDVSGAAMVADLAQMPHLLIAGATGSGKSVCLNAIIVSLLFQNAPDELKLLLIDPKRVELTKYNGIPHLIAPVMVDTAKVIGALRWMTREMDRRYKKLAELRTRNIGSYNQLARKKGLEPLPMIVVIVDELADLMLSAPDDVERTICRLAQMARATGIHLVIATQRPSVDVVTGLIKANFPSRISFAVTSQVDSRVILDSPGAEKLLGRGDMLFMAPDSPKLQRIQGCFVSDKEIDDLVAFWCSQLAEESETPHQPPPWDGMDVEKKDDDQELLQRGIALVRQHKQASASFLQRHLRVGYPRAARMIDQLEEAGIVGPAERGGRSRAVLDFGEAAPVEAASASLDVDDES